jgi:putative nucleotidyltransferase with HDIG domain
MSRQSAPVRRRRRRRPLDAGTNVIISEIRRFLRRNRAGGYVVGGFLRDWLLGRAPKDLDVVVEKVEPSDLAAHLHNRLGFSRPAVFPRFKTALTVGEEVEIEICQMQDGLEEDAARRDFTINCLYAEPDALLSSGAAAEILDPTGRGLEDLRRSLLRAPVDPCRTLWLDPLRILRALRLSATLGFRLDRDLGACIPRLVYLLNRIAQERVRTEIEGILLSRRVVSTFRRMQAMGVCDIVLPELALTHGFDQSTPYHAYDLFTHTLKTVASAPPDLVLRLGALLHDLGKPYTRSMKSGRAVYYGHQEVSAELAMRVMGRLRFPRRLRQRVAFLVRHHMIHYSKEWSDKAVRRFVRRMGPNLDAMLQLAEADQKAQIPGAGRGNAAGDLRKRISALGKRDSIHFALPIGGREIMSLLGIGEGPLVGKAKEKLLEEASTRDRPMGRGEAVEILKKWARRQKLL